MRGSALQGADRVLGFFFGILRGGLLVCLSYLLLVWLMPDPDQRPEWLREGRSLPYLEQGTEFLQSLVPEETLIEMTDEVEATGREIIDDLAAPPSPGGDGEEAQPDYDDSTIEQLIDNTGEGGSTQ